MKDMQKLQPQMAAIKKKYKEDKQQQNKEIMGLYKRHKVNPVGGCLPMVLQIPVFIALYEVLSVAIDLRHAPFMLVDHRSFGNGPLLHLSRSNGRLHVPSAEDVPFGHGSHAGEDDDDDADGLHLPLLKVPSRPGALLAR